MAGVTHKYDDIIGLPHHKSAARPHMSMQERAAQFSPFAALTGHGDAIRETERMTDSWEEPGEDQKQRLDEIASRLMERISERPWIKVTYFVPDEYKSGGSYVTATGRLRIIDTALGLFIMCDGRKIQTAYIVEISDSDAEP